MALITSDCVAMRIPEHHVALTTSGCARQHKRNGKHYALKVMEKRVVAGPSLTIPGPASPRPVRRAKASTMP